MKKYGLPASDLGPVIQPMDIWSPQDLSSIWKCLNTGSGARKNGNVNFCHLCTCCGNDIARLVVEENRYVNAFFLFFVFHYLTYLYFCKKKGKERCYHWSLGDENSIATFWQQLEQHLLNYLSSRGMHYEEVKHCSKVIYDLTDLTGQNNRYNIDYIIDGATDAERKDARVFFSNLLTSEL
jgi:hypothetical protein